MSPRRRLRCESLEVRHVLDSVVVFNEVMYNPAGVDESMEWIELHNQMAVDIDLSAWELTGGVNYKFAEGTIIPGHGYMVVAADPIALENTTGFGDALGPYVGQLDNSGETVRLRDRNDRELDQLSYRDEGDWPTGADGSGASLAKINEDSISAPAAHWRASPQIGGTPGAVNFPTSTTPSTSVELISLDDTWTYDATNTDNGTAWRNPGFTPPASWSSGQGFFGAGDAMLEGDAPGLIAGVTATATSQLTTGFTRFAANTTNGSGLVGNTHSIAPDGTMWLNNGMFTAPNDLAPEITFDLGSVQTVDYMKVWNYNEFLAGRPELLSRGVSSADILIAGADQVFSVLIANQAFAKAPGDQVTEFAQTIDMGGVQARYVKFDIHGNHGGDNNFVGLSEVQFVGSPVRFNTNVPLGANTYYFRKEFAFSGDPARTQLFLNTAIDDGAIVYLNGVEVYRQNMPGGPATHNTLATTAVGNASIQGAFNIPAGSLVLGPGNVLAVEVHQASPVGDNDMVFAADLTAVITPPSPAELDVPLVLNEVGAGGAVGFFVEIGNRSNAAVNVGGYVVQSTSGQEYVLPSSMLAAGGLMNVPVTQLGFTPALGDRVFLLTPNRSLLADAFEAKTTVRGRSPDLTGEWLYPDVATPGSANSVPLHDEIVINEIMYNHRPNYSLPGTPPTFSTTAVLSMDAVWKYNRSGANLGSNWYQTNFPVDNLTWLSGAGPLGRETNTGLKALLQSGTDFDIAGGYTGTITTYYFQTEFTFTGAPEDIPIEFRRLVDDGAIFYLNGIEIPNTRFLMPAGVVTSSTQALSPGVGDASLSDPIGIPLSMLNVGNNVLSVEVHQLGTGSTDVFFGMEIFYREQTAPAIPPTPFSDNGEEWIELYNKSNQAVDISGWRLDDAVDFTFAPNTMMPPNSYIVVARDAVSLAAEYPAITIAGSYSGGLSDQDDRIRLRDNRGNTADDVHYFDGGRWAGDADGVGSSLELRDPNADNSSPEAWAASDEGSKSQWRTYTYSGVPGSSAVGKDNLWNEFVLGMLDGGEILLDDLTVTQLTGAGAPVQLLQNGSFEGDIVGNPAAAWRIIGNHRNSEVIVDPTDPNNQVLLLKADGSTEHMSNHAETTLKNGATFVTINASAQYEISFRAKWISGSPQLHTRLYFNRLPRTTILQQPALSGTPGAANSTLQANIGPTYEEFRHSPAVPVAFEPVVVSTVANDPNGVAAMTLWYSVSGGAWISSGMSLADGKYIATIPGQAASTVVQFYVEGQDSLGATSTFPADGRDSWALYKVNDGLAATNGLNNFRIVVTGADGEFLHNAANWMSNGGVGATVIYNENEIFYDVSVRLKGSEHSRVEMNRLGFSVAFHSDQMFRGFHKRVSIDRSESTGYGQREMLIHQTINHVGGILSKYDDLIQVITPLPQHTGGADLQLARYGDEFLDEQFANGSDGTVYEYELVYDVLTASPSPEGAKVYAADSVTGTAIRDLGDDTENYRWTYLIKNNGDRDDFSQIIAWAKVMGLSGSAFTSQIGNYIDVDQWLRAFAVSHLTGVGDNYSAAGDAHNVEFYVRPDDGKVLMFPHDLDAFFQVNRPLVNNGALSALITVPANAHMYYGHVQDMLSTTYNLSYMTYWANHYGSLLPAQPFASHLAFIGQRSTFLSNAINAAAGTQAAAPFNITTPNSTVNSTVATLSGTGWVNVRNIRKAGDPTNLPVTWNSVTGWTVAVPVDFGPHDVVLEAYDFQGTLIGTDTVTIDSTVSSRPLQDFLRITELMYHPADPTPAEIAAGFTDSDNFEFLELKNISTTETLDLSTVRFVNGVTFDFSAATISSLAPGEYALLVVNEAAFTHRYGAGFPIAGTYSGQLNNAGETIRMEDALTVAIQEFTYDDTGVGWHPTTDGDGYSLVIVNPLAPTSTWNNGASWRPSGAIGGSPGTDDSLPGDFNLDGLVGTADLAILQSHFGTASGATSLTGDMDGDGDVDRADAAAFARQFGRGSIATPPSPAAAALAVVRRASDAPLRLLASRRGASSQRVGAAVVDAALAELSHDPSLSAVSVTDVRLSRLAATSHQHRTIRP
ncbi:MAG: lamin tail domain-containing protein [Pirellulales bacterium]